MVPDCQPRWRTAEYKTRNPPYPETPDGQRDFLDSVNQVVLATPDNLGRGIFWWEPAVAPSASGIASRGIFDQEGNVLPVITLFDKWVRR